MSQVSRLGKINARQTTIIEDYAYLCASKQKKQMIQSRTEKWGRPYPIIMYGKEVAMQVASLVETEEVTDEQGQREVVLHRHPIVSHVYCPQDEEPDISECEVWDQVEEENVSELMTEDDEYISWHKFERFAGMRLYNSTIDEAQTDATYALSLFECLEELAIDVGAPPTQGTYFIVLDLKNTADNQPRICQGSSMDVRGFGDKEMLALVNEFPLWAKGSDDEIYETLLTEMKSYLSLIGEDAQFHFTSIDNKLKDVADRLNKWMGI